MNDESSKGHYFPYDFITYYYYTIHIGHIYAIYTLYVFNVDVQCTLYTVQYTIYNFTYSKEKERICEHTEEHCDCRIIRDFITKSCINTVCSHRTFFSGQSFCVLLAQ